LNGRQDHRECKFLNNAFSEHVCTKRIWMFAGSSVALQLVASYLELSKNIRINILQWSINTVVQFQ